MESGARSEKKSGEKGDVVRVSAALTVRMALRENLCGEGSRLRLEN